MDMQKNQDKRASFDVRLVSPTSFPFDPRFEQMRTTKVLPPGRVFGSHKRDQSRLLSLPDEILWQITEYVAKSERGRFLSQFALVHRECRQLARPHQFVDMFINRTEKSWEFLRHVLREIKQDESEPAGWSLGPPIGACIRSLSVTLDEELCVDHGCATNEEYDEWLEYWQGLISDLTQAVESAMPNLERMYWMDTASIEAKPPLLRSVLQHSSTGHLHELAFAHYVFDLFELDEVVAIMPPGLMRLRSLALGYDEQGTQRGDGTVAYLAESILRRCALTLESFVWNSNFEGNIDETYPDAVLTFLDGPIEFPKLRKFWAAVDSYVGIQPSVLESILASPLESFSPSAHLSSMIMANNFVDKFPLPCLRTFAISAVGLSGSDLVDYVEQVFSLARLYARQIEELFIYLRGSANQLVDHLSGGNFCNLRSLCFSWVDDSELRVLKAIGVSLVTLEELSFGFQPDKDKTDQEQDWDSPECFSHDDIIAAILPLKKLVRLGVCGDEYIADWCYDDWAWHRYYKEFVWFNQGASFYYRANDMSYVESRGRHSIGYVEGSRGHHRTGNENVDWRTRWLTDKAEDPRSAMVEIAKKYATAFPRLQGLVCGRVMLEIAGR